MPEFHQDDFYEVNPSQETEEQGGKSFSFGSREKLVKRAAFGGVLLLVLIFLGIFITNFVQERRAAKLGYETLIEQAETNVSRQIDVCDGDGSCEDSARSEVARTAGAVAVCEGIENEITYIDCVSLIALENLEVDECDILSDEYRTLCKDTIFFETAVSNLDFDMCEDAQDEYLRSACDKAITNAVVSVGECHEYNLDISLCDDAVTFERALATGDPGICKSLGALEDACYSEFGSIDSDGDGISARTEYENGTSDQLIDSDGDGLPDYDEYDVIGTDPSDSDTDGDGYPDGEEVSGGYDPLN